MKLAVLFTAMISLAGIASADPISPQQRREMRMQRRELRREKRIQRIIRKYDLNHDGVVDQGEMPPRLARRLQRLDRNGDGWIDAADLQPRPRFAPPQQR